MATDIPPEKRTVLPIAGIILSLISLLLVPIVLGRESRALRDHVLENQVPFLVATEAFRSTVTDEMAATRMLLSIRDPEIAGWTQQATSDREVALQRIRAFEPALGPGPARAFDNLETAIAGIPVIGSSPVELMAADTTEIWSRWSEVSSAVSRLVTATEVEIAGVRARIDAVGALSLVLTGLLTFLAFASAMVAARMHRQVRRSAHESEGARREQQILLESSGEGIFGLDASGRCTFLNPAGARLIGYPEEEVLGGDLRSLILRLPAEALNRTDDLSNRGFAGGEVRHLEEAEIVRKDGSVVETECLTSPIEVSEKLVGAVVTLRNISQRKAVERERLTLLQREQSLREKAEIAEDRAHFLAAASELFARSLDFDTTVDNLAGLLVPGIADSCVIYLMDEAGAIRRLQPVHVNPERQRILSDQFDRYPPRIETLIAPVRLALRDGLSSLVTGESVREMKGVPGDAEHQSVIGAVGLSGLIVVPLRARGRIAGAISYGAADSSRSYGVEDLRLAEDLSTRAALALDNARLYQQSQAAVRARNEVLGIVSHDLRNPLNAVRFGAQALLRHWPPHGDGTAERNQLGAITKAADRMHRLIRDLLDVAQIDAGRLAVEQAPVPVTILLNDAIELSMQTAADRGIEVVLDSPHEPAVVSVDGERILQVFLNLLGNAIKFSPSGSEVQLGARRHEEEVVFHVRDAGRGIEADHIPRIFDRYWRARSGSRDGAGLGLAISRGIVESHGGRIWVESSLGGGSTFYFTLPVSDTADLPAGAKSPSAY